MYMFVLAPFDISRLEADEAMTEMTGEIYSLSLGGWMSKSMCISSCAMSNVSTVLNLDIEMCLCVQLDLLHQF